MWCESSRTLLSQTNVLKMKDIFCLFQFSSLRIGFQSKFSAKMSASLEASARPTIDPWPLTAVLIATDGTGTVTRKPIKIESNRQIILKKPFCFVSSFIFTTRYPFFKKPTSVITFHLRVLSEMVYYNLIQCKTLLFDFFQLSFWQPQSSAFVLLSLVLKSVRAFSKLHKFVIVIWK